MNGLETNSPWQDLLSCARPPAAQGARAADATSEWRPIPKRPGGDQYQEIAGKLRDIARQCRFPIARRELLHLAGNYERRGDHIVSGAVFSTVWGLDRSRRAGRGYWRVLLARRRLTGCRRASAAR
jgi:hypothetical protein